MTCAAQVSARIKGPVSSAPWRSWNDRCTAARRGRAMSFTPTGKATGLSTSAVHHGCADLSNAGVIRGYAGGRGPESVGLPLTAFISVSRSTPAPRRHRRTPRRCARSRPATASRATRTTSSRCGSRPRTNWRNPRTAARPGGVRPDDVVLSTPYEARHPDLTDPDRDRAGRGELFPMSESTARRTRAAARWSHIPPIPSPPRCRRTRAGRLGRFGRPADAFGRGRRGRGPRRRPVTPRSPTHTVYTTATGLALTGLDLSDAPSLEAALALVRDFPPPARRPGSCSDTAGTRTRWRWTSSDAYRTRRGDGGRPLYLSRIDVHPPWSPARS